MRSERFEWHLWLGLSLPNILSLIEQMKGCNGIKTAIVFYEYWIWGNSAADNAESIYPMENNGGNSSVVVMHSFVFVVLNPEYFTFE